MTIFRIAATEMTLRADGGGYVLFDLVLDFSAVEGSAAHPGRPDVMAINLANGLTVQSHPVDGAGLLDRLEATLRAA